MGTTKPEKRMKKVKQTKKRGREVLDNGESAEVENFSKSDYEHDITEKNDDDVDGAKERTYKSKKARKNKMKDTLVSEEQRPLVKGGEKIEPVAEVFSTGKKEKSKKARKNKGRDSLESSGVISMVNDEENFQSAVMKSSAEQKGKLKRAREGRKKDTPVSNELSALEEEIKPDAKVSSKGKKGKSKKAHKQRIRHSSSTEATPMQEAPEVAMDDVYQISSGEDDESKGMKKWIKEYHESRPGLEVLQEQIDDFITAYEEQEEEAKRKREAEMDEEGWTVVVHRKGGKKTTDSESGVAVGSVAEAAVRDKMAKKKSTNVGLDFYRFQKKEAHRSEIMKLQSKFEEDKKRIQQIRAARKFKPY